KLINSGHYQKANDGKLRSVYFAAQRPYHVDPATIATPFIAGSINDIQPGKHPVFRPTFPYLPQISLSGLEVCVRIEKVGRPPVYVVDNHHLAHFAWAEALAMDYIQRGSALLHIDAHLDMSSCNQWFIEQELRTVADQVVNNMYVGTFILPAIYRGVINDVWFFNCKPEYEFAFEMAEGILWGNYNWVMQQIRDKGDFTTKQPANTANIVGLLEEIDDPKRVVLDIDVDAFVKNMFGYNKEKLPTEGDFQEAAKFLARIARRVGVVTIATSPGYADQRVAIPFARQVVREIIA
ncbi:MAG: UPF0489 family protein, partial [Candidatus Margulisiibacteriota bacterium]